MYFVEGSIHDLSSPAAPHVYDTLSLLGKHERSAFLQLGSDVPNMEELNHIVVTGKCFRCIFVSLATNANVGV